MSKGPPSEHTCSFCTRPLAQAELMFVSHVGGTKARVCSRCVADYAEILDAHRRSPELAAQLIAARNEAAAKNAGKD